MNQPERRGDELDVRWGEAAKALAKAASKSTASAVVRGVVMIGFFLCLNLALSVILLVTGGLLGGGHGGLILLPIALLCFAPPVFVAALIAQKNGIMRIAAAVVASQAALIVEVSSFGLRRFLRGRTAGLEDSRGAAALATAWRRYVGGMTDAPWIVRKLLAVLSTKVPVGELLAEMAHRNVPADEIPREVAMQLVDAQAVQRLEPSARPYGYLLAANALWYVVVHVAASRWLVG